MGQAGIYERTSGHSSSIVKKFPKLPLGLIFNLSDHGEARCEGNRFPTLGGDNPLIFYTFSDRHDYD